MNNSGKGFQNENDEIALLINPIGHFEVFSWAISLKTKIRTSFIKNDVKGTFFNVFELI